MDILQEILMEVKYISQILQHIIMISLNKVWSIQFLSDSELISIDVLPIL